MRVIDTAPILELAFQVAEEYGLYIPEPATASWLDRVPWLLARKEGVGSSEIWRLFSKDPADRLDLYQIKTGEKEETDEVNADMRRGRVFEPIAADEYEELTKRELVELPLLRSRDEPLLFTDLDRLILPNTGKKGYRKKKAGAWEAKVPRWHMYSRYKRLGLTDAIVWQVQNHLAITGLPYASITIFHADSLSLLEWDIKSDPTMIAAIREEVPRFWRDHIIPRKPPTVDDLPVDGIAIPETEGTATIRTEPEWMAAAATFREADPLYREAKELRELAVEKLRKAIGDSEFGLHEGGGVAATLSPSFGKPQLVPTLDAISDAWPLDSKKFKAKCKEGQLLDGAGKAINPGKAMAIVNELALDVQKLKVKGKSGTRFTPRILREDVTG